jgi:hypothetical protein
MWAIGAVGLILTVLTIGVGGGPLFFDNDTREEFTGIMTAHDARSADCGFGF